MLSRLLILPFLLLGSMLWAQGGDQPEKASKVPANFIDELAAGDVLDLEYSSTGCFHSVKVSLKITREEDGYYVHYDSTKSRIDDDGLKALREFGAGLAVERQGGCTTIEKYMLSYGGKKYGVADGSCGWFGFSKLEKALKLEEKLEKESLWEY